MEDYESDDSPLDTNSYWRLLRENLFRKTGATSFKDFYYAGGTNKSRNDYFTKRFIGLEGHEPEHKDRCECTHPIKQNCYIEYMPNKQRCNPPQLFVVGNCCIKRFLPLDNRGKTCDNCFEPHKNRKDNLCNDCREYKKNSTKHCLLCGIERIMNLDTEKLVCDYCFTPKLLDIRKYFVKSRRPTADELNENCERLCEELNDLDTVEVRPRYLLDGSNCPMPFGKHKGKPAYEVDDGYALWWTKNIEPRSRNATAIKAYFDAKYKL